MHAPLLCRNSAKIEVGKNSKFDSADYENLKFNIWGVKSTWRPQMKLRTSLGISIFFMLFFISLPVQSEITRGVLLSHKADENIVYNWFSYVPANLNKFMTAHILIAGQNGNIVSDNYAELIEECHNQAQWRMNLAESYNYILITPVIPRSVSNWVTYTVSLDKESLLDPTDFNQRPDLKVNLMIDQLTRMLTDEGYNISDKVFIEGFSAGAMFAQRYCLLHPERVQAIAAGQCGGSMTVPGNNYDGTNMNWPVGVNDFSALVGYELNMSAYQQVPQFIYIGDKDTKNSTVDVENGDLFTPEQSNFLIANFGHSDPVRLENQCEYLKGMGCNVTFKLYPFVGHQYTQDMIEDTFAFFEQYKINSTPSSVPPDAPKLYLSTKGTTLNLLWGSVRRTTKYTLFYAPIPYEGPSTIQSIDMGNQTGITANLWSGAAFHVAIRAHNDYGDSEYSNIELISIP